MTRRIGFAIILLMLLSLFSLTASAEIDKDYRVEPSRDDLSREFFIDFFTYFAPDMLSLDESVMRAVYDVLATASRKIEGRDYTEAANLLAVIPDDVEGLLDPVVKMREEMSKAEAIEKFAEHEARGELMAYHRTVWTAHPEFAEDFKEFSDDFAKRASRREKDAGAPYIVEHLNDYGFVPKGEGGAMQAYLFLWAKFNAVSKFAAVCDRLGLNYEDVKIKDYHKSVSESLGVHINASREEAWSREQGRASWTELIDQYVEEEPQIEPLPETITVPPVVEETEEPEVVPVEEPPVPEEEILEPLEEPQEEEEAPPEAEEPEIIEETITEPVEEIPVVETIEDEPPVAEEEPELIPLDEPPLEVVIDPMSLFLAPDQTPVPEETVVVEETEPVIEPIEETEPEVEITIEPFETQPETLVVSEPFIPPAETEIIEPEDEPVEEEIVSIPLILPEDPTEWETQIVEDEPVVYGDPIDPSELPSRINAVPIPPGEISGKLSMGVNAETGRIETTTVYTAGDQDEIRLQLAAIAEDAIDNAAENALQLGREALELAKALSEDPSQQNPATVSRLEDFRTARSGFLAAAALIDRYELEQYLQIPIEVIEEEIIAELRRPYDDLKASSAWEEFRTGEKDFDDAFLRISSDFRQRRERESIYSGEMAALEAHIVDYESYMLQIEELLSVLIPGESTETGDTENG